jgi:hypothetical protein
VIEHTALPFHLKADDPDGASQFTIRISSHIEARYYQVLELIVPAVNGTWSPLAYSKVL